jgi:hypothetical protein
MAAPLGGLSKFARSPRIGGREDLRTTSAKGIQERRSWMRERGNLRVQTRTITKLMDKGRPAQMLVQYNMLSY